MHFVVKNGKEQTREYQINFTTISRLGFFLQSSQRNTDNRRGWNVEKRFKKNFFFHQQGSKKLKYACEIPSSLSLSLPLYSSFILSNTYFVEKTAAEHSQKHPYCC
jgi:hypothetical protein